MLNLVRFGPLETGRKMDRRVTEATEKLFGDKDTAERWLKQPNPALGDTSPEQYMKDSKTVQEVLDLIGRLEHGISS